MWAQYVRNRIDAYLVCHLLELQNVTSGTVDLRSGNVKWYYFVNFTTKIVVLYYSLRTMGPTTRLLLYSYICLYIRWSIIVTTKNYINKSTDF
jgi:hypothetical protein